MIENSSKSSTPIEPWFITGLIDAEGSFTVSVLKSPTTKSGWYVGARFLVTTHVRDLPLLKDIQAFFGGVGKIVILKNYCTFRVDSLRQIVDVIIPHFDKYTLITHKLADYFLFARYWCGWLRQPYHSYGA